MTSRFSRPPARGPVAPIHRGPQANSTFTANAPQYNYSPNAALLIDFDNVTMGVRSDMQTELKNLLSSDLIKGRVQLQRAYADWRRYPQYMVPLAESSIDTIQATAYGSSKKNATDIRLAVDAMELLFTRPEIGTYILLSGDSDFASLVTKLKEYGKYVIGVGIRESSSDLLVMNCDEYYSYNALAGLVSTKEEQAPRRDPWELVVESVLRMQQQGDVMRADRLKQVMQEIDASFDEKNLGMAKFSRFVQEAAQRGLLSVTRHDNGQIEVAPMPGASIAAAPAAAPRDDAGERAERERFRRGRGRGRGRDRERGPRVEDDAAAADTGDETAEPELADVGAGDTITLETIDAAPREAGRGRDRGRGRGRGPERDRTPAPPPVAIGVSGERLTRDEAYSLVRRAVESLVSGDSTVSARQVREQAFNLLGRDSESLSERNFDRILRDAHDADAIDLRRRGDSYEVAAVEGVASVSDQLERAEATNVAASAAPAAPPAPRGMGPRGGGERGGRRGGRPAGRGAPPPDLFAIGVVDESGQGIAAPVAPPADEPTPARSDVAALDDTFGAAQAAPVEAPNVTPDAPAPNEGAPNEGAAAERSAPLRRRNLRGRGRGTPDLDLSSFANVVELDAPPGNTDAAPAAAAPVADAPAPAAAAPAPDAPAATPADVPATGDRPRGGARKTAAKSAAKSAGKTAAKSAGKTAAKSAGKTAAKSAAKSSAKTAAKSARKTRGSNE